MANSLLEIFMGTFGDDIFEHKDSVKAASICEEAERLKCESKLASKLEAIKLYNKSICFSNLKDRAILKCFLHRFLIFKEWNMHYESIINIDNVCKFGFVSPNMRNVLLQHKIMAENKINNLDSSTRKFLEERTLPPLGISGTRDRSRIAQCIRFNDSKSHLITTAGIKKGTVIAYEKVYCAVLPRRLLYERCTYCHDYLSRNVIPCRDCTMALFCSKYCHSQAMIGFHQYECPIINFLEDENVPLDYRLTMRLFTKTRSAFGVLNDLLEYYEEVECYPEKFVQTVFDFKYEKNLRPRVTYSPIYFGRQRDDLNPSEEEKAMKWLKKAFCVMMIQENRSNYKKYAFRVDRLMEFIAHNLRLVKLPLLYLGDVTDNMLNRLPEYSPQLYSMGVCAFGSLLVDMNATANVSIITRGRHQIYFTNRDIEPGENLVLGRFD